MAASNPNTNHAGHGLYCWTHGLCNHKSIECKKKEAGHKDEATLENRMDGSEKGTNRRNNFIVVLLQIGGVQYIFDTHTHTHTPHKTHKNN